VQGAGCRVQGLEWPSFVGLVLQGEEFSGVRVEGFRVCVLEFGG
jgi:hypothetical protein